MTTEDEYQVTTWDEGPASTAMERVRALIEIQQWGRALHDLHGLLAQQPEEPLLHYFAGLCHYHLSRYNEARTALKRAIQFNPTFDPAYWMLAMVALQQDRYYEGLQAIDTALELDSEDSDYLATRAALLLCLERPREALTSTDAALAIDPEHEYARQVRAGALIEMGRCSEAEEQAITLLASDPNSAVAWYLHGIQMRNRGKLGEAKSAFLESLRIDPENMEVQDALLQVLAAKHPFFALFWRWSFFLSRFSSGARWGIILGLWALMQVLKVAARAVPQLMPFFFPLAIAYVLFCIYTWVAMPLFKLAIKRRWIR
jgi:tetratricopeptide (TPR) repeat protein